MRFVSFGVLLMLCWAGAVQAEQYPPGPGAAFPDTLYKVNFIQNPAAVPHPTAPDTVWGIGGIIIGFDPIATGFAIYIQNRQTNGSYSGVDVFTGGANYINNFSPVLAVGDSIIAYGRLDEFQGETELRGFNSSAFNDPLPAVRRINQGNSLPAFHRTTVNELQELPSNLAAEQWEGTLVRVNHTLRVVRNSDTGGLDNSGAFLAVDNTLCPGVVGTCDTLFVDGTTLASPNVLPPGVSALVDSVQGIYGQRDRGYRIQLRSNTDMFGSFPPGLLDAYAFHADSVELVFDRDLTTASAEDEAHYTLSSTLGPPNIALSQPTNRKLVHLRITNGLAACAAEGITANGLVALTGGVTMTTAATKNFRNGICPIATIQAPDPDSLLASPCEDRSLYAGTGSTPGTRITTRGVCTGFFGTSYFIQTAAGGPRSGILVFAPGTSLIRGRQYLIAGAVQEFFGETELVGTVKIVNEAAVTEPTAMVQTVAVLRDTTCDTPPPTDTGEDYEHCLVKVVDQRITEKFLNGTPASYQFRVAGPYPTNPDTILVDNDIFRTFDPTVNRYATVTGILDLSFGTWRIQPRGNFDISLNATLGVGGQTPGAVSFAVAPNPARSALVTFGLPKRDRVLIGIYDIAGRRRTTLVDAEYPAGTHTLEWNGKDKDGKLVGSGMYFYKLTIGGETFTRRAVLLN